MQKWEDIEYHVTFQMAANHPAGFPPPPPPPVYQIHQQPQQRIRFNVQQQLAGRPGGPQYTVASGSLTQVGIVLIIGANNIILYD